jgi:lipopolysaccharide transport system permease protein
MTNSISNINNQWDLIIRPKRDWKDLQLDDLWRYRELIMLFVWRDFVAYYKQTILGPVWYIIQPLLTTIVFTVIFGNIAGLSTDGLPPFLFYMAGNTIWGYFSACVISNSNTFTGNSAIFGKVYFPRLCVPISVIISNLISFSIRLVMFLFFALYFFFNGSKISLNWWIMSLPLLILIMAFMGLGLGIIVSSLTTKYRDLQQLVSFGITLLMYATPVIYPLSSIPSTWKWFVLLNPMTPIVEIFRFAFLGTSVISPLWLIYSFSFTLVVLIFGVLIFNQVENTFMDTV